MSAALPAIAFRPLARTDIPSLLRWWKAPHAARWFPDEPETVEAAEEMFGPCIDGAEPTFVYVIEIDGRDVGYVQHYMAASYETFLTAVGDAEAAGIDFLIGDGDYVDRGLGPHVIVRFVRDVVVPSDSRIRRVVSTPDPGNGRSIRALEKAGFRQVETIEVEGNPERLCVLDVACFQIAPTS